MTKKATVNNWIKIQKNLHEKPEVLQLAFELGLSEFDVAGRLIAFWSWWDTHSETGKEVSQICHTLDRLTGVKNFCETLKKVGWLKEKNGYLIVPNFDKHLGESMKKRLSVNARQQKSRNNVT